MRSNMKLRSGVRALQITAALGLAALSMGAAQSIDQSIDQSDFNTESIVSQTDGSASVNLKQITSAELPSGPIDDAEQGDWEAGSRAGLKTAITRQLALCQNQSATATWNFAGKLITRKQYCVTTAQWFLKKLDTVSSLGELYLAAKNELQWFQSTGKPTTHEVQFTGYYYPVHHAKRTADSEYKYPVYSMPTDLVQITVAGKKVWRHKVNGQYVPYFSRAQIVAGALQGKGLEIGYLNNPVDAFILEVQGSGALIFTNADGTETRQIVNFAAQNGYEYTSLGGVMRRAGVPEEYISLQGIRKYFTDVHPEQWTSMSNQNQSFVFYHKDTDGPFGASQAVLTPKHSIAVDLAEFPMGAIGLIQTDRPSQIDGDQATSWKNFFQFVVAQDTGGAIKSPGRVDIFYGEGNYAEVAAGRTDRLGKLFFCLAPTN
jgi:membrane-bound lytic murein transglycosylase A